MSQKSLIFLKSANQYKTSSLTKFLFNKYGYTSYLSTDKFPDDFNSNRCLALFVDIKNLSGMVRTKVSLVFKDCNNTVVYTSKFGSSKNKDYEKAYHIAIRDAFRHLRVLKYKYAPKILSETKVDVSIPKPIVLKKGMKPNPEIIKTNVVNQLVKAPVIVKEQPVAKAQKVISLTKKTKKSLNILRAKATLLGYQLIDKTATVVLTILKTNIEGVFIIKDSNGVLYNKNGVWIAEFYQDKTRVLKKYEIKF